ncbi:MAG: mechanosensitive ion channel [Muribaculaceae bacterium]|nr:mechanosensitive ion channel [Muribaculaceae bacterium]
MIQIPDIQPQLPDSIPSAHQELEMIKNLPVDELLQRLVSATVTFAINLAIAIAVFYLGRFIIGKLYRLVGNIMLRRKVDTSITSFTLSMIRIVLYFILIVTVIGILGIETSSFIALFASAGVAIGMALSGTLQNFAGGILILLLKPYRIGDYIEAQGYAGTVREIQIFSTIICTPDNKSIIVPNGPLSTSSINNYSKEDYRRVDWIVSISYGDNIDAARKKILEIIASDDRIVKQYIEDDRELRGLPHPAGDPALAKVLMPKSDRTPVVKVNELAASSVDLKISAWTQTSEYWNVFYDINERIYNELPSAGINFPFPQMDVHLTTPDEK